MIIGVQYSFAIMLELQYDDGNKIRILLSKDEAYRVLEALKMALKELEEAGKREAR